MFELFRFMTLRSAQPIDETQVVSIAAPTVLQDNLAKARTAENARAIMTRLATEYTTNPNYVRDISTLTYHQAFSTFYTSTLKEDGIDLQSLRKLIKDNFKYDAAQLVTREDYHTDKERIFDSIVAARIALINQPTSINDLGHFALAIALIQRVAGNDASLNAKGTAQQALQLIIALPAAIFPLPAPQKLAEVASRREAPDGRPTLEARASRLSNAINSLMTIDVADFAVPRVTEVARVESEGRHARASNTIQRDPGVPLLMLRPEGIDHLPPNVKETLADLNIDLRTSAIPSVVKQLENDLAATATLGVDGQAHVEADIHRVGNEYIDPSALYGRAPAAEATQENLPTTHGDIKPVGIGDLLVVRQQLKRYEAGEISYIENVMKTEARKRTTQRSTTSEQTFLTETTTTTEQERDLQTAERFELKQETDNTLKEDLSVKAGVAISAKYGPMLEVKSNVDVSSNTSIANATKVSSSYSKDVTNRAATKVTETIHQQQTQKIIEQFQETDEHGFDNTGGKEHVIGIYQWIDKIYEAQVFNYGKRMLFDVMVPEPAAFLLDALVVHQSEGDTLVKPDPFTLNPNQLNESNYYQYVSKYEATGVVPPPAAFLTVSKTFDEHGDKDDASFTKSFDVQIPADYDAIMGTGIIDYFYNKDKKDDLRIYLSLGQFAKQLNSNNNSFVSFVLSNEEQYIPATFLAFDIFGYAVGIEIICRRSAHAYIQWQLDTHGKIMQAYVKQLGDYNDKLAALAEQQGTQIATHNPELNRTLEQNELKKACISLLTSSHLDFFSGITEKPSGAKKYPLIDLTRAEVEGNYIRFFEQAFEWEQMMYFFYPYFWGRYPNWYERILLDDTDTTFAEFLKAGAARVVFPVRPGFQAAIINFLDSGEILNFNDVNISSPLYVPIIQEIKESEQAPGKEVAQGDPWDVRVPTTVVRLRPDDSLPAWKKDAQGNWVPA